jgi:hypothetical protein
MIAANAHASDPPVEAFPYPVWAYTEDLTVSLQSASTVVGLIV